MSLRDSYGVYVPEKRHTFVPRPIRKLTLFDRRFARRNFHRAFLAGSDDFPPAVAVVVVARERVDA